MRVLDREQLDSGAVESDEPGRRVGHLLAAEERHEPREHADAHAPGERWAVGSTGIDEPRADDEIRVPRVDRREKLPELGRVVLAIAVEPHRDLVPLVPRVPEPGLHRAADADVEEEPEHGRSVLLATRAVSSLEASSTTTTVASGRRA